MRAIVRGVSASIEHALASYFGNGPTSLDEAKSQHLAYVSKLKELGLSVKEIEYDREDFPFREKIFEQDVDGASAQKDEWYDEWYEAAYKILNNTGEIVS